MRVVLRLDCFLAGFAFGEVVGFFVAFSSTAFFGAFHSGYLPCSFLKLSRSSCCAALGVSLAIQHIAAFSMYPSFSSFVFILALVFPPYPDR